MAQSDQLSMKDLNYRKQLENHNLGVNGVYGEAGLKGVHCTNQDTLD